MVWQSERIRRNRIAVNLEDIVYDKFCKLAADNHISTSNLARSLMVKELFASGLLNGEEICLLIGARADYAKDNSTSL